LAIVDIHHLANRWDLAKCVNASKNSRANEEEGRLIRVTNQIEVILFDMGGTLRRNTRRNETDKVRIIRQILEMIGSDTSAEDFTRLLTSRDKAYDDWATANLTELDEIGLWTKWMLPDWPAEVVEPISMKLNGIWRDAICTRAMFPEARPTILELHRRGYQLGLVSNTTSSIDAANSLKGEGVLDCFGTIILSSVFGERKPAPGMLLEAANKMGVLPERCAYVGDRPDWDVVAAHAAGLGQVILLHNPLRPFGPSRLPEQTPDLSVDNLLELLQIFPLIKR